MATLLALSFFLVVSVAAVHAPGREHVRVADRSTVELAYRYRSLTASQWAARFRHRTRQLQVSRANSRRHLRAVIHGQPYGTHWLERAFLCIKSHEGAWTSNTGNGFYGGMQMDSSFQASYGGWALKAFGTADKWPISVQLSTAILAYESGRGFYPWPNTARYCGLL